MFSGIVEELGSLKERNGDRFVFAAERITDDAQVGASIAVNGVCLTVVDFGTSWWEASVMDETLRRSNLGELEHGSRVNFERPVRLQDRLGGHLVQGHVDGVGTIDVAGAEMTIRVPRELTRYIVEKGSIAVDGISLTVVQPFDAGFSIALIPHTLEVTTLGYKTNGDTVNIEVDVMAKYAEKLLAQS